MRSALDNELKTIDMFLIKLAGIVGKSFASLEEFLSDKNITDTTEIKSLFDQSKEVSQQLETASVKLFVRQQPVASDLRRVRGGLNIMYSLNRVSEICLHAAELNGNFDSFFTTSPIMQDTKNMLENAINSYLYHDRELAKSVIEGDEVVDEDFNVIKQSLVDMIGKKKVSADEVVDFILVAKYLERIADHAVNISKEALKLS